MSHKKKRSELQTFAEPDWAVGQSLGDDNAWEDHCRHGIGHPNKEYLESLPKNERAVAEIHTCDDCCENSHKIECKQEENGSYTLHIPDDLVQGIVQAFVENALYNLVKENELLNKDLIEKEPTTADEFNREIEE